MVSIYLIAYNEAKLIPYTIRYYKQQFPGCNITVYDNFSTDGTKQIAKYMGCEVFDFWTDDKLSDKAFKDIKNNCWKEAKTDWVIVADVDEWLHIRPLDLKETDATIIQTRFTNMINLKNDFDVPNIDFGVIYYDFPGKCICFNKKYIKEINYDYGAHKCYPIGEVRFSEARYLLLHYKYINLPYTIERYQDFGKRLSIHNKRKRLSYHYLSSKRRIKKDFENHLRRAKKIDFTKYIYL